LAHHEEELLHAGDRLERGQLQPFARGQALRHRDQLGRELLQQVALAPEEGEGAAQLIAAEVALHLRLLIVGPPDPERLARDVERAPLGLPIVPAHQPGLLHLHQAFRVLHPADRRVRVVLPEAGGEILRLRVVGVDAAGGVPRRSPGGRGEQEGEQEGHGGSTPDQRRDFTRRASFAASTVKRSLSRTRASWGRSPARPRCRRRAEVTWTRAIAAATETLKLWVKPA